MHPSKPQIAVTHSEPHLALAWRDALVARFPGAVVRLDTLPDASASLRDGAARFAVGWAPPAGFFESNPGLRAFFSAAAGVEHVLRNPGLPPELPVVRLEDAGMGQQMIEYACHEVFRLRGRHAEYERQQREQVWRELDPLPRARLRIGVFGVGVLGLCVARALAGCGYEVAGFTRSARHIDGLDTFSGESQLGSFLARTDVLILLAPLTNETRRVIRAETLAQLPAGAYVVNLARGGLIDDDDLLAALDAGHLSGASLDVFNVEPLPHGHRYWTHVRVRMTPHISAITLVPDSADQVARKIEALTQGAPVSGVVDRARGY